MLHFSWFCPVQSSFIESHRVAPCFCHVTTFPLLPQPKPQFHENFDASALTLFCGLLFLTSAAGPAGARASPPFQGPWPAPSAPSVRCRPMAGLPATSERNERKKPTLRWSNETRGRVLKIKRWQRTLFSQKVNKKEKRARLGVATLVSYFRFVSFRPLGAKTSSDCLSIC